MGFCRIFIMIASPIYFNKKQKLCMAKSKNVQLIASSRVNLSNFKYFRFIYHHHQNYNNHQNHSDCWVRLHYPRFRCLRKCKFPWPSFHQTNIVECVHRHEEPHLTLILPRLCLCLCLCSQQLKNERDPEHVPPPTSENFLEDPSDAQSSFAIAIREISETNNSQVNLCWDY